MERESIEVLKQAIEIQRKKSNDYQNPRSTVKQADYYPSGILTIYEIMHGKMLRIKSLLEAQDQPNFESLEDSFVDLINYASFGAAWLRGGIPGQDTATRDIFNQKITIQEDIASGVNRDLGLKSHVSDRSR